MIYMSQDIGSSSSSSMNGILIVLIIANLEDKNVMVIKYNCAQFFGS